MTKAEVDEEAFRKEIIVDGLPRITLIMSKFESKDLWVKSMRVLVYRGQCVFRQTVKFDCTLLNSHRATKHSLCVRCPSTHTVCLTHT